jgi:glutamate dehydrogenase (NADP+)
LFDPHLQGKRCFVSGSGNVAQYAAEKLIQLGAVVLTLSDSTGYVYEKDGFTMEQVHQVSPSAPWDLWEVLLCNKTSSLLSLQLLCWVGVWQLFNT